MHTTTAAPSRSLRGLAGLVIAAALLLGCDDGGGGDDPLPLEETVKLSDPCAGRCTEVELCIRDEGAEPVCARLCANQLRCWSGCCLPQPGTKYNVCRPAQACFER